MIRKIIPSFLTSGNLVCGTMAVFVTFRDPASASLLIFLAVAFDFLDGLAARMLDARTDFGKQLDSLADQVSFGVAPGFILYTMVDSEIYSPSFPGLFNSSLLSFLIPLCAGLRLARFNTDKEQSDMFKGLPTPAAAVYIASLPLIHTYFPSSLFISFPALLISGPLLGLLMVSGLPMFALKFARLAWKGNEIRYIFVFLCLLMLVFFREAGIPLSVIVYVSLSLINFVFKNQLNNRL